MESDLFWYLHKRSLRLCDLFFIISEIVTFQSEMMKKIIVIKNMHRKIQSTKI